jgi:hypothetical protein
VGETIGGAVAVGSTIAIAGVFVGAIVGLGAGGAAHPPINPAMPISQSEVFMSSSRDVELPASLRFNYPARQRSCQLEKNVLESSIIDSKVTSVMSANTHPS